jgi:hypothetical protein
MATAPGTVVVNFAMLGAFKPDGSVDDEKLTLLLADPQLIDKAKAANALVTSDTASHQAGVVLAPKAESAGCNDPDMMEQLASYIADEMNCNIHDISVSKIRSLLAYDPLEESRKQMALPWYAQIGAVNPQVIAASNGAAAMTLWTEKVGQNRPWDHKPKIREKFGGYRHKHGNYDYFYDIWSNIHYGYVGRAAGFSESVLSDGAGGEQIVSDSLRKIQQIAGGVREGQEELKGPQRAPDVEGLRAWDDAPDRISISIGIELFNDHPAGGITAEMVMDKVLGVPPEQWGKGVTAHVCKI